MATSLDRAQINRAGENLLEDVKKMYSSLTKIKELLNGSTAYFQSEAGDTIRRKFNTSAEKFEEFQSFLNSYGEFLKTFSGNVQSYEEAVKDAANQIPDL